MPKLYNKWGIRLAVAGAIATASAQAQTSSGTNMVLQATQVMNILADTFSGVVVPIVLGFVLTGIAVGWIRKVGRSRC